MCPCEEGGLDWDGAEEAEDDAGVGPPGEAGVYGLAGPEPGLGLGLPWGWWGAYAPPLPDRGLFLSVGETPGCGPVAEGIGGRGEEDGGVER